jgi:hypothetical protein
MKEVSGFKFWMGWRIEIPMKVETIGKQCPCPCGAFFKVKFETERTSPRGFLCFGK